MNPFEEIQARQIATKIQKAVNLNELGAPLEFTLNKSEMDLLNQVNEFNIIEKSKSMPIGTIHNGFKKIADGKWRKVSSEGKTKEEHEAHSKQAIEHLQNRTGNKTATELDEEDAHHSRQRRNLDNKDYSDEEVTGGGQFKNGDKVNVKGVGEGVYGFENEEGIYVKFKNGADGYFDKKDVAGGEKKLSIRELENKNPNEMSFKDFLRLKGSQGLFSGSEGEKDNIKRFWNKANGISSKENNEVDHAKQAQFHREQMEKYNKEGNGAKYHYHMAKRDEHKAQIK